MRVSQSVGSKESSARTPLCLARRPEPAAADCPGRPGARRRLAPGQAAGRAGQLNGTGAPPVGGQGLVPSAISVRTLDEHHRGERWRRRRSAPSATHIKERTAVTVTIFASCSSSDKPASWAIFRHPSSLFHQWIQDHNGWNTTRALRKSVAPPQTRRRSPELSQVFGRSGVA